MWGTVWINNESINIFDKKSLKDLITERLCEEVWEMIENNIEITLDEVDCMGECEFCGEFGMSLAMYIEGIKEKIDKITSDISDKKNLEKEELVEFLQNLKKFISYESNV